MPVCFFVDIDPDNKTTILGVIILSDQQTESFEFSVNCSVNVCGGHRQVRRVIPYLRYTLAIWK